MKSKDILVPGKFNNVEIIDNAVIFYKSNKNNPHELEAAKFD